MQVTSEQSVAAVRVSGVVAYRAAVAVTALVAVGLRTAQAGMPALDAAESALAYQAWAAASGTAAPLLTSSPLVSGLQALVFFLFGSDDVLARAVPFVFSCALALTPLLFRGRVGPGPALATAVILAISPLFSTSARYLGGESLVLTAGAVAVWAGSRYLETRRGAYLNAGACATALAWAAGPEFHTLWVSLAIAGVLYLALLESSAGGVAAVRSGLAEWSAGRRDALLVFAAVFVSAATLAFLRLDGLGAALTGHLNLWLQRLATDSGAYPIWPAVFLSEPLVLAAGGAGLVATLAPRRGGVLRWLVLWATTGAVLVLLMRGRTAGDVMVAVYPLALLGGIAIAGLSALLLETPRLRLHCAAFAVLVCLLAVTLLALVHPPGIEMPERFADLEFTYMLGQWILTLAIALLILLLLAGVAWALEVRGIGLSAAALVLALLSLLTVRTSAELRFGDADLWRASVGRGSTSTDVRTLGDYLRRVGSVDPGLSTKPREIMVADGLRTDLVWYVRGAPGVRFGANASRTPDNLIVVEPVPGGLGAGGYAPTERRFRLRMEAVPDLRDSASFLEIRWDRVLRWLIYRETLAIAKTENVVMRGVRLD